MSAVKNKKYDHTDIERGGAAVAREAHTLKVAGSSPAPATSTTSELLIALAICAAFTLPTLIIAIWKLI